MGDHRGEGSPWSLEAGLGVLERDQHRKPSPMESHLPKVTGSWGSSVGPAQGAGDRENWVPFSWALLRDIPSDNSQNSPGEGTSTVKTVQNMTMLIFNKEMLILVLDHSLVKPGHLAYNKSSNLKNMILMTTIEYSSIHTFNKSCLPAMCPSLGW